MTTHWTSIRRIDDEAQNVAKFVYERHDAVAESVLYKYPDYATRTVICCSTQAGCPMGCRFCGAGDAFVRSLTTDEIIEQVDYSIAQTQTDPAIMGRLQIMFMSMGEPLLNLKALIPALHRLYRLYPNAALLISTSAPRISAEAWRDLVTASVQIPTVGLQFSVHEATDDARNALIPFKAKYSLQEISELGEEWAIATGRRPFFNYCAHDDNSGDLDADRLVNLFNPDLFCATVSVVCERNEGLPATNDHQRSLAVTFGDRLVQRGFDVRVFDPAGQDTIGGGCGQLWRVQQWFADHADKVRPSIGRGLPEVHAPAPLVAAG